MNISFRKHSSVKAIQVLRNPAYLFESKSRAAQFTLAESIALRIRLFYPTQEHCTASLCAPCKD